jgi:LPS export ABC transporter protein LptC
VVYFLHMRTLAVTPCTRRRAFAALVAGLLATVSGAFAPARATDVGSATRVFKNLDAELRITGMTFVGSRNEVSEFVLRAERAIFKPETNLAELEQMEVTSTDGSDASDVQRSFDVRCDRGELNVETNDFLAEGDVRGSTGEGRRYQAPWVRYNHEQQLLYTDAPVSMQDETGSFRGDGFRYYVKERRFRLLGNVSLVHGE